MADVQVVAPMNMGKGIEWNPNTKQYEVNIGDATMAGNVAVLTGDIAHGGTIPLPAGFAQEQCKWVVMPRLIYNVGGADVGSFQVFVSNTSRLVTVHTENQVHSSNRATYIIIGIK